jgi:hypothetical protein
MNREEKLKKIEQLKKRAGELKKEVDYFNALQLALSPPLFSGGVI